MDITLSFLAKSLDKHGITLLHITYPPLDYNNMEAKQYLDSLNLKGVVCDHRRTVLAHRTGDYNKNVQGCSGDAVVLYLKMTRKYE